MKLHMQYVFKRYEKKYLLSKEQYKKIIEGINGHMQLDQYGKTTICNIYFDTENDELIRTSIDKPLYKEKFRVRSYGVANNESTVFLEIKKKLKGIVYKRRITMPLNQAKEYVKTGVMPQNLNGNIPREIDYMINRYKLYPKVFIRYDRMAYFDTGGSQLRITFDTNLKSRRDNLEFVKDINDKALLTQDLYLMEIKIPGSMPIWLSNLLTENKVYPTSFSKYGKIYLSELSEKLNKEKEKEDYNLRGDKNCSKICLQVS